MYGYKNSVRLSLVEYLLALVAHIIFAFASGGLERGRIVLLVSAVMITLTFILCIMIPNERVVVALIFVSVLISTTIIGCICETLAFSILIFSVMTSVITIFMESKYIIYASVGSSIAFVGYLIFLPDQILKNVPSLLMFAMYIVIYIFAAANLYVVVYYEHKPNIHSDFCEATKTIRCL